MNPDEQWQALLRSSASTFAGETTPPFGLTTRVMAQLRAEQGQQELMEKIGWRAFLASLAILGVTVCLTLCLRQADPADLEPGVHSLIQIQNVQIY